MMKKIILFLSLSAIILLGCNNNQDERIVKAEQQIEALDSVIKTMQELDSAEIAMNYKDFASNIEAIQIVFNDTDHTDEEWRLITQYSSIKKPLRDYPRKYSVYMKNLKYSITQIKSLIYEYEEGKMDSTKFDEYYQTEEAIANNLMIQIQEDMQKTQNSKNKFDSLNPQIEIYIDEKLSDE